MVMAKGGQLLVDLCFVFALILCAGPVCSRIVQVFIPDSKSTVPHSALQAHNKYRDLHHSVSLNWSESLATQAQAIADHMAGHGSFLAGQREMAVNMGQNLAKLAGFMSCDEAGEIATNLWYSQAKNYSYSDPRLNADTDTFTQVVWENTKEVGVGCARSSISNSSGPVYVVALYKPAGNIPRLLRENVLAPGDRGGHDVYATLFKRNFNGDSSRGRTN